MSMKVAQFSLISTAVLLGLWSTRIDLSDLYYMATTRSVFVQVKKKVWSFSYYSSAVVDWVQSSE